jgi:hypothetical protein
LVDFVAQTYGLDGLTLGVQDSNPTLVSPLPYVRMV